MKNIMSRDLEATPMGGATSKPPSDANVPLPDESPLRKYRNATEVLALLGSMLVTLFVYFCCRDVGRVSP